jgi:hypothetical protein
MRTRLFIFAAVVLALVAAPTASAQAASFSINVQIFSIGPCDPHPNMAIDVGVLPPFTDVAVLLDYPGSGGHEGFTGQANVSEGIAHFFETNRPNLIGGTTTITAFLDDDLEPDPGAELVTTTVTYCPPPLAAEECKKGGFENFPNLAFKNQGDCVSYVATQGRNPPAG